GRGAAPDHRRDAAVRARLARGRVGRLKAAEAGVELPRRRDALREVLDREPLVRRVDVALSEREAGEDRRDAAIRERRDDRHRAAGADEDGPDAERTLERLEPELHRRLLGPRLTRRRTVEAQVELGPFGEGLPQQPLGRRADRLDVLPGRKPDRELGRGLRGDRRVADPWLAAEDADDVEGRLGPRTDVELLGRAGVERARALL